MLVCCLRTDTKISCYSIKTKIMIAFINPLYSGNPSMNTFANSEDPDEMLHFIRVYTVCKGKKDLQARNEL